ncbi:hypothetical protein [Winogradskyella aurantiaca]|uniref:hypothetical protein n=1 Tax=Winogradskyella aurantiaca TaxID=2219558 RepID=UPI000E1D536C|nr:hypothetical protein [Winogradskyella aurantiaca]
MKKLLLAVLMCATFSCQKDDSNETPIVYDIEGKWLSNSAVSNTMYIFEDGVRYTYYCTSEISDDCQSLYESFQANDGNHIPGTNPYTFEDGTLTVDLHFGNELVAPLTFECDGNKVFIESLNPHYLYRLDSNCD